MTTSEAISPVSSRVEDRYLAERFVMDEDRSVGALRALVRRVREKGLVSMSATRFGRRSYLLPFLNGTIRLASGAPSLAEATGAALLPVSTVRTASGAFVTTIHPALELPADIDRTDRVPALLRQCAVLLESSARNWPDQFV